MKQNLYTLLTILFLTACTSEELGTGTSPADGGQTLDITIPDTFSPFEGDANTRAAGDKTQWEEGDVIYIQLRCYGNTPGGIIQETTHIAQRTAGGGWEFNKPLTVPPATTSFGIIAWYTSGVLLGETITGDLLCSQTPGWANNTDVTLDAFGHWYSRITFTGLDEGDKIEFQGNGWAHRKLDDDYDIWGVAPAPLTADTDGNAVLYAEIFSNGTHEFRIKPDTGDATGWYTFDPGEADPANFYRNRTYTIDCERLLGGGGNTPGSMEKDDIRDKARAPFLAWAQSDRWQTEDFTLECDIDLTGVDWTPIGPDNSNYFKRTFDGGGHTISGLTVDKPDDHHIGLFGYISSGYTTTGTVRNLTVKGSVTGNQYVGGIAGWNNGIISGCNFTGTVTANHTNAAYAGGIAGGIESGTITGCHVNNSTITGAGDVGGITGDLGSSSTGVIACLVTDTKIGGTPSPYYPYFGGIAGSSNSRLVACVSAAETTLAGTSVGSITGRNDISGTGFACYWQTGNGFGGAIGRDGNTTPQEGNCTGFAAGTFTAEYVAALNGAIEEYNDGQGDEAKKCKQRWKVSETAGGLPGLETVE